jgi:hypothetical protein
MYFSTCLVTKESFMSNLFKKDSGTGKGEKAAEENPKAAKGTGKTTKQLMDQHLHDEKDIITDEDFKNLKLDMELPADEAHQPLVILSEEERPKDEDKDPKMVTPWDVIK